MAADNGRRIDAMSTRLSSVALLAFFVCVSLPVRADKIDTEHMFAFTIGTDTGEVGEKEMEGQTTGRFGKRDGSYTGLSEGLSAEFNPMRNFRLEVNATSIYHDIAGVTGLDDRRRGGWQAVSLDLRYRLLDREHSAFGLLVDAEPRWGRIDETIGEPVDQYNIDLSIAIDKELIPNRVVAAFNALYEPETSRSRVTGITTHESTLGFATALMIQVRSGIFLGGEGRYLRRYEGLGLNTLLGQALFLGPTVYANLSPHSWIAVAWSIQVAGRSVDDPGWLDLTNFERQQARLLFGFTF
jgi:hypothetical protein